MNEAHKCIFQLMKYAFVRTKLIVILFERFILKSDGSCVEYFGSTWEIGVFGVVDKCIPKTGFYFLFFSAVFECVRLAWKK